MPFSLQEAAAQRREARRCAAREQTAVCPASPMLPPGAIYDYELRLMVCAALDAPPSLGADRR